eukprot:GHVP01061399.1.p1 GENE.GHVP01061399.1~~GHVP01061399.1.p1  ORF type:complete len:487 (+),score=69.63 GHVP01061399.1:245-1705(+)
MGCALCKSQVPRHGVFISTTDSCKSTSSKKTESNESSRSNKTTDEHEKRASQIAIEAAKSVRNEKSIVGDPSLVSPQSFDDHSPFLARYGIKRRTVSSARLKKDVDVWNKYKSTGKIMGSGISGEVRVIEDKRTSKKYALKTLSLKGVKPAKTASLHNEVAIFLQLDHPNIAKLFEVYETLDAIHMVMELCQGKELYDRLYEKKRYSEHDAANVTRQMLSAINYCHNHMICHRDLKLENWVYADGSEDAHLKLIDFGFSRIFNPGIPMTAMHGTVYYVSPEVMEGSYVEKCDLWSIGVIVYMLLSGSPPFNGSADHEILLAVKRGRFSFNGPRWEGTSNEAKKFICRLLQINPDLRPSAAEALQDPWLTKQKNEADSHVIDVGVLATLKSFADGNRMKRAALALLAFSSSPELTNDIEKQFLALDTLKTGSITVTEIACLNIKKLIFCTKIIKSPHFLNYQKPHFLHQICHLAHQINQFLNNSFFF